MCNILTLDRAANQKMHLCKLPEEQRKQVDVKQKYNQDTDGLSQLKLESVGDKMPNWEPAADRGLWVLSDSRLSSPARIWKKCCNGQKTLGSICSSLSPSPNHLSHTTNINPFENKVCEIYLYKEMCSFDHWSSSLCLIMIRIYLYMYVAIQQMVSSIAM